MIPTIAHTPVTDKASAEAFLQALIDAGLGYHCEEDATEVMWQVDNPPTPEECEVLNDRMDECYDVGDDFDPCEYMLDHA